MNITYKAFLYLHVGMIYIFRVPPVRTSQISCDACSFPPPSAGIYVSATLEPEMSPIISRCSDEFRIIFGIGSEDDSG